ncbi:carboxypeptidase-like regulatory domain-containing protein [Oligoflexus tunisiensis]|uniref:carboxypeptidase-like regulatory domain-containing protein n=1 Tax=Oligoflexus tunisiensis TaxID=708132 RepID=UPI00114CD90F|nr:carboxypeptidase-like regulatory domain-containing protein [Oligoflexus tunisiensis]
MRSVKQPAALPMLALTAWLAMPAHAADGAFAVGDDFLSPETARTRSLPGTDLQNIKHMPAKTLSELMAAARGQLPLDRKAPVVPLVLNPDKPMVYVAGPKTKGELTPVVLPDDMKAREREEEEILREAEEALKMDLPLDPGPRPLPMAQVPAPSSAPAKNSAPKSEPAFALAGATLELTDVGNELRITPKTLLMSVHDDGITVVDRNLRGSPQIFLRNSKIVRWDAARKKLDARDTGRTELYVTYRDQLYIVPIEVIGGAHRDPLLATAGPASFQKLTSIMPLLEQPYASYGETPASSLAPEVSDERPEPSRQPLTLATSVAQVEATRDRLSEQQSRFFYPDAHPDYRTLDIQVLDERSSPENAEIFPVSDVTVRIVGTRLKARTTADGHAKFGEIPAGSRFFVQVQDEKNGQIVPTISEVALYRNGRDQVLRARTMNYRSYSHYLNILDLAQDTNKASLCARVMSDDGRQPLAGYQVSMNVEADGPYYVSQLGWPQPGLHETDSNGRFCFFNVKPGLVELTFEADGSRTALSMPVFAGAHTEEDLPLLSNDAGRIFLAAMPSAVDQIYDEKVALEQPLQPIDFVDMITVGENQTMAQVGDSVLGYEQGTSLFKGRLYTVAQAPEFETALYTFDRDKQVRRSIPVAPLLQRGYIQDVFHELAGQDNHDSIAFDVAMGSVVVLHRTESGMDAVKVALVDNVGRVYNQGWTFGNTDQGLTRTVFFNMNPGVYSVIVESQQGVILSLDTIAVDFWAASIVQTGAMAHYNLQQARRED